ncbi:MAG: BatA domain-containing protein, partial [Gemmataceae bacterium]|nr:BatA domain-containing protein [Gemmataceae bacterium]
MLTLFLNPFTMLAGAGFVLAPIIIHLINRLRYRKVPWAAMEFLLKSLKKNRRKLILKQLLLLLMRCLLVLLVGLLRARYIGSALGFGTPRGTLHVVLLDDTASQGDQHREEGATTTAFARAKAALVDDIATGAAEAGTPQTLEVIRLSTPDESFRVDRLDSSAGVDELKAWLANVEVTTLHADVAPAVEAAKRASSRDPRARRVLHVVSD